MVNNDAMGWTAEVGKCTEEERLVQRVFQACVQRHDLLAAVADGVMLLHTWTYPSSRGRVVFCDRPRPLTALLSLHYNRLFV